MITVKLETTAALHTNLVALDENGSRLDALIVACCETVQAIAWSFALGSCFTVDVEDLYSIGMVAVCAAAARAVDLDKPMAYLCSAAKRAMVDEWRRVHACSVESLDALLSDEGSLSLIDDTLPPPPPDASVSSRRLCALHAAVDAPTPGGSTAAVWLVRVWHVHGGRDGARLASDGGGGGSCAL